MELIIDKKKIKKMNNFKVEVFSEKGEFVGCIYFYPKRDIVSVQLAKTNIKKWVI